MLQIDFASKYHKRACSMTTRSLIQSKISKARGIIERCHSSSLNLARQSFTDTMIPYRNKLLGGEDDMSYVVGMERQSKIDS